MQFRFQVQLFLKNSENVNIIIIPIKNNLINSNFEHFTIFFHLSYDLLRLLNPSFYYEIAKLFPFLLSIRLLIS